MRRRSPVAIALALLLLLTACTAPAPKRAAAPPASAGAQVETIRIQSVPGHPLDPLLDPLIAEFQQQYPQYRVEKVPVGKLDGSASESEILSPLHEGTIDLIQVTWWDDPLTAATQPLDSYIQKDNFDLKPFGDSLKEQLVEGRHYYLPVAVLPSGILTNADMAAAAGVTVPAAGWTWEELRAVARKVSHQTEGGRWVPALPDGPVEELVRYWLEGKADRPAWEASDAEIKEALAYFRTLITLDRSLQSPVVRTYEGSFSISIGNPTGWVSGLSVFLVGPYLNAYTERLSPGFKVSFTPMPSHPGRPPAAPASFYSLAIGAGSKQPDAAWAFLKFAAGRQGALLLAKSGTLPAYAGDGVKEAWFSQQPAPPAATESFFTTKWVMLNDSFRLKGGQIIPFYRLVNRTLAQSMDVDEALALYHQELNAKLGGK